MKLSRMIVGVIGTFTFLSAIYMHQHFFKAYANLHIRPTLRAYGDRWLMNTTRLAMNAFTTGSDAIIPGKDVDAKDINSSRTLNLFRAEHLDTFARFIKFNVSEYGKECSNRKFLIYTCKTWCGGWGDRLKGLTSTFLLAILTNRTFLIDMAKPCEISKFIKPHIYDWKLCLQDAQSISSSETIHGISLKKIDSILTGKLGKNTVVRVSTNVQEVRTIRKHKVVFDVMPWVHTLSEAEILGSILGTLFKPSPELSEELAKFSSEKIRGRRVVCSHIRMGKNPTIPNDGRLKEGAPNVSRILDFLKQYDNSQDNAIFIATDSAGVRNQSRALFSNFISTETKILHVDRAKGVTTNELCDGFSAVLLDHLILSRCDVLVLTRSNFGAMAAYMRGESRDLFLNIKDRDQITRVNLTEVQQIYKFV